MRRGAEFHNLCSEYSAVRFCIVYFMKFKYVLIYESLFILVYLKCPVVKKFVLTHISQIYFTMECCTKHNLRNIVSTIESQVCSVVFM